MTESKKESTDFDDIKQNDISRSQLSNNLDNTNQKEKTCQKFIQINEHGDEVIAEKYAPIQLQHNIKQSIWDQKQTAKKLQNDNNTKNKQTQTSQKFDSIIQNQNERPEVFQEQVEVNQFHYSNHQNNLINQPVHYVALSRSSLHLHRQRTYCTPCLKILMFLIFLFIGAGLTFFFIQKRRKKNQIFNKKDVSLIKPLSKTIILASPVSQKTSNFQPKLTNKFPENIISIKSQTNQILPSAQPINMTLPQKIKSKIDNNITYQQQRKIEQKIILKKGSKLFCPSNQLLINGNCLSCEFGEEWFGLQCIRQPILYKHIHLLRKDNY